MFICDIEIKNFSIYPTLLLFKKYAQEQTFQSIEYVKQLLYPSS